MVSARERRSPMSAPQAEGWTRRRFIGGLTVAGTAGLLGLSSRPVAAEPPPETTTLRVWDGRVTCIAPTWVAQELLYSEGFTDVQYVTWGSQTHNWPPEVLLSGEVDLSLSFVPSDIMQIEAGAPLVILAGSHIGCIELVGNDRVRSTRDLKGKTVSISELGSDIHTFIAMFAAYVGLDPHKDINWVIQPWADGARLLAEGSIDAFVIGPSYGPEIREKKIGHVLVNTTTDRPWSQYFCCLVASTKAFVRQHPVATKRALRAILKAADVCALEPERTARRIVDRGMAPRYDAVLQGLKEIPYQKWREYDTEDTVRFFALRLHEMGIIKSSPQKIIAQGTDWRFLNELKRELKG
jgi:NitT/TauT family transport system substrate-binding protein